MKVTLNDVNSNLEIRKRAFCYCPVVFEEVSARSRRKWASSLYRRKMRMYSFKEKTKQNKKRKNLMTCNYTMIQGIGNWRHFIIIHYSKEFILAATQNMYEYCIRLNIWCRRTVTYYVNAYCRKGNRSDLCRSPKRNSHIYVNLWSP